MAIKVPELEAPSVEPGVLSPSAAPTPSRDVFGAGVAEGLDVVGQRVAEIAAQARQRAAEAQALEGESAFQSYLNKRIYDPTTGYAGKVGMEAFKASGEMAADIERQRNDLISSMGSVAAKRLVANNTLRYMHFAQEFVARHAGTQNKIYQKAVTEGNIAITIEMAAKANSLEAAKALVEDAGSKSFMDAKRDGLPDEMAAARAIRTKGQVADAYISSAIGNENASQAEGAMAQFGDLLGDLKPARLRALQALQEKHFAQKAAADVLDPEFQVLKGGEALPFRVNEHGDADPEGILNPARVEEYLRLAQEQYGKKFPAVLDAVEQVQQKDARQHERKWSQLALSIGSKASTLVDGQAEFDLTRPGITGDLQKLKDHDFKLYAGLVNMQTKNQKLDKQRDSESFRLMASAKLYQDPYGLTQKTPDEYRADLLRLQVPDPNAPGGYAAFHWDQRELDKAVSEYKEAKKAHEEKVTSLVSAVADETIRSYRQITAKDPFNAKDDYLFGYLKQRLAQAAAQGEIKGTEAMYSFARKMLVEEPITANEQKLIELTQAGETIFHAFSPNTAPHIVREVARKRAQEQAQEQEKAKKLAEEQAKSPPLVESLTGGK